MKMNKIIMALCLLVLMTATVSALEVYKGLPGVPYIIRGSVDWNSQFLSGVRLEVTNVNTGYVASVVTDSNGYWQQDTGNWLTSESARPPVMYGDVISVRVVDGCGSNDVCTKTIDAMKGSYVHYAEVNLVVTGSSSCPACTCPGLSCPECKNGGGSGGVVYRCTEEQCEDMIECPAQKECPDEKVCADDLECELCGLEPICPDEKVCEECVDCPGDSLVGVIIGFLVSLFGGVAVGRFAIPSKK